MAKVKTFYSKKGYGNPWKPLAYKDVIGKKINGNFDVIEVVMQLVNLYGLLFPVKVPHYITVNAQDYFLTIKYKGGKRVIVGYANNQGEFYKFFASDKEKTAKKALAQFLKSKGIV